MSIGILSVIGLGLIAAGWLYQFLNMKKGENKMEKVFLALYVTGVSLLTIDGYFSSYTMAILNLASLLGAVFVMAKAWAKEDKKAQPQIRKKKKRK